MTYIQAGTPEARLVTDVYVDGVKLAQCVEFDDVEGWAIVLRGMLDPRPAGADDMPEREEPDASLVYWRIRGTVTYDVGAMPKAES